ncbi:MAG TPA: SRPBCC family protein [Pseudonocardiaceae bacterium]|nr:SRPBCC family protein [Pseudonocardiaceae bacterium]
MTDNKYVEHGAEVAAPADFLYPLVAEATAAPLVFPGTVHVEFLAHTATEERLRIWAVNGENARNWTSHRRIDADGMRVTFGQEKPVPPVASMVGQWHVEALDEHRSKVTLSHTYQAVDGDAEGERWIANLVDMVSGGQLAAMTEFAGLGGRSALEFTDSVELSCPVATAYAFVADPDRWADAGVPVEQVKCRDAGAGIQLVDLVADGTELSCARVGFENSHIGFKMLRGGPLAAGHTGTWTFEETQRGCRVGVRHVVAARYPAASEVLGAQAGPDDVRAHLAETVPAVSAAVLRHLSTPR